VYIGAQCGEQRARSNERQSLPLRLLNDTVTMAGSIKSSIKPRSANEHNYISIKAKRECAELHPGYSFVEKRERA